MTAASAHDPRVRIVAASGDQGFMGREVERDEGRANRTGVYYLAFRNKRVGPHATRPSSPARRLQAETFATTRCPVGQGPTPFTGLVVAAGLRPAHRRSQSRPGLSA